MRYAPADSTPRILEGSGWRQDTIGRIKARWERANPAQARQQKKQQNKQKKQNKQASGQKRQRSKAELAHIYDYYKQHGGSSYIPPADYTKTVRFFIARRPYIEPAYKKNKQKILALMQ